MKLFGALLVALGVVVFYVGAIQGKNPLTTLQGVKTG